MKRNIIILLVALLIIGWIAALHDMVNAPKELAEHIEKAKEYEEKGIYVDAITEYEEALKYKSDDSDIILAIADDYLAMNSISKYTTTLQDLAENNQMDNRALDILMNYYLDNDMKSDAVRYISSFFEEYPDNENAQKWYKQLKGSYQELYCQYDEMNSIYNDYMVVKSGEYYGMTDAEGRRVLELVYKEIYPYSEDGFALAVNEDDEYIYIDQDGNTRVVPEPEYQNLGMLTSSRIVASKNGKFGYLDEKGNEVTEFSWDELTGISNKIGAAQKNGKWAIINADGKEKTGYIYDDVIVDDYGFCSLQSKVIVKENGAYHIVNEKGEEVGNATFDDAKAFSHNGYAAVCKKGKWGFVDIEGNMVIDCIYEDADSFSYGYAAICKDGYWGYIDENNDVIIEPTLIDATAFSSLGTAAVKLPATEEREERWRIIQLEIAQ